jgi:hypothetical protein
MPRKPRFTLPGVPQCVIADLAQVENIALSAIVCFAAA